VADIPEDQLAALRSQAESGNPEASNILTELGHPMSPDPKGTGKPGENGDGPKAPGEEEQPPGKPTDKVDRPRESTKPDKKTQSPDSSLKEQNRGLRIQNRDLKETLSQALGRLDQIEAKIQGPTFTQEAPKPVSPDETLSSFFEDPLTFLSKRDEAILKKFREENGEFFNQSIEKREGKSRALNIIRTELKDFDEKADMAELLELIEEQTGGMSLAQLAQNDPVKAANYAARRWNERNQLPPAVEKEKAAAASTAVGAPKSDLGGKPTLESLNTQAKEAALRGDNDALAKIQQELRSLMNPVTR